MLETSAVLDSSQGDGIRPPPAKKLKAGLFGNRDRETRARFSEVIAKEDKRKPDAPIIILNTETHKVC